MLHQKSQLRTSSVLRPQGALPLATANGGLPLLLRERSLLS